MAPGFGGSKSRSLGPRSPPCPSGRSSYEIIAESGIQKPAHRVISAVVPPINLPTPPGPGASGPISVLATNVAYASNGILLAIRAEFLTLQDLIADPSRWAAQRRWQDFVDWRDVSEAIFPGSDVSLFLDAETITTVTTTAVAYAIAQPHVRPGDMMPRPGADWGYTDPTGGYFPFTASRLTTPLGRGQPVARRGSRSFAFLTRGRVGGGRVATRCWKRSPCFWPVYRSAAVVPSARVSP